MPTWKFLLADTTGAVLWGGSIMGIGFVFRAQIEDVAQIAERLGGWMIAVAAGLLALWLGWKQWQRRRFIKSLKVARIQPEEVLARLTEIAIVDLRTELELKLDGRKLPGALWFDRKELALHHAKIPRDRDVVLYCT
jgi:hypothetical protein